MRANQISCVSILILSVISLVLSSCAEVPCQLTEGTTTSYVEEKEVLVYAPRAARAQKVVFDTPDKQ